MAILGAPLAAVALWGATPTATKIGADQLGGQRQGQQRCERDA